MHEPQQDQAQERSSGGIRSFRRWGSQKVALAGEGGPGGALTTDPAPWGRSASMQPARRHRESSEDGHGTDRPQLPPPSGTGRRFSGGSCTSDDGSDGIYEDEEPGSPEQEYRNSAAAARKRAQGRFGGAAQDQTHVLQPPPLSQRPRRPPPVVHRGTSEAPIATSPQALHATRSTTPDADAGGDLPLPRAHSPAHAPPPRRLSSSSASSLCLTDDDDGDDDHVLPPPANRAAAPAPAPPPARRMTFSGGAGGDAFGGPPQQPRSRRTTFNGGAGLLMPSLDEQRQQPGATNAGAGYAAISVRKVGAATPQPTPAYARATASSALMLPQHAATVVWPSGAPTAAGPGQLQLARASSTRPSTPGDAAAGAYVLGAGMAAQQVQRASTPGAHAARRVSLPGDSPGNSFSRGNSNISTRGASTPGKPPTPGPPAALAQPSFSSEAERPSRATTPAGGRGAAAAAAAAQRGSSVQDVLEALGAVASAGSASGTVTLQTASSGTVTVGVRLIRALREASDSGAGAGAGATAAGGGRKAGGPVGPVLRPYKPDAPPASDGAPRVLTGNGGSSMSRKTSPTGPLVGVAADGGDALLHHPLSVHSQDSWGELDVALSSPSALVRTSTPQRGAAAVARTSLGGGQQLLQADAFPSPRGDGERASSQSAATLQQRFAVLHQMARCNSGRGRDHEGGSGGARMSGAGVTNESTSQLHMQQQLSPDAVGGAARRVSEAGGNASPGVWAAGEPAAPRVSTPGGAAAAASRGQPWIVAPRKQLGGGAGDDDDDAF